MRLGRTVWVVALTISAGCSQALLDDDGGARRGRDAGRPADALVFSDGMPLPPLSVDYADPSHGPFVGGTQVTLRGRGFAQGMAVTIGGHAVAAGDLTVLDAHRAVVVTPPGAPGPAEIGVTSAGEQTSRPDGFTYDAVYLEPTTGSIAGGTLVRIRGLGTSFAAGVTVTFGSASMTGIQVVNPQELTGYTPPGEPGTVAIEIQSHGATIDVADAFTYEATVNASEGGFGGGAIEGTLNVTVIDDFTGNGVAMAYVVVGDPAVAQYHGFADPFGQITFSGPGLGGQLTITAGHPKYESGAFVGFDARDATMFLEPLPPDPMDPPPGGGPTGPPPSRPPSSIGGDIVFGGTTTIGSDSGWALVPEPTQPDEIKRTYIYATGRDIFSGTSRPLPGGTIDFVAGQEGWHYEVPVSAGAFALVAIAGLYNPNLDPDGPGPLPPGVFVPYAMGVMRNLVVGIGESLDNVTIPINIPLDTAILVQLRDAPAIGIAGTDGPTEYRVSAVIDLGGEGVIALPGSRAVFSDKPTAVLPSLAPLSGAIADASYSLVAGAYTTAQSTPVSVRIVRGVRDLSVPVAISGFLGVPRAVDPPEAGTSALHHLVLSSDGGGGTPTFIYHRLSAKDGTPVFRVLARGDRLDVPLYDLTGAGLPALTTKPLFWTVFAIRVADESFDTFNYGLLNANRWDAYATDVFDVAFP
jgi:hypothetical protein